jgi:hypothetical protein
MNPRYKIGVIVFGLFLPLLGVFALVGILLSQKNRINEEYEKREQTYNRNENSRKQTLAMSAQLKTYRDREEQWDVLLANSDVGKVTAILGEIQTGFAGTNSFKQDNFAFVGNKTGPAASSAQPSISFDLALSGTFQSLQESLLSLESRLPNLTLNSMALSPQQNGNLLEAKLSYSAWTE